MPFNYKSIAKTGSVSTQIKWVYFHSVEFWGGFVCEFHYGLYMVDMSSDIEKTDSHETPNHLLHFDDGICNAYP